MQNINTITGMSGLMIATFFVMSIVFIIFWLMSVIDVILGTFKTPNNKILWIILLVMIPPLATILYQILGKSQKEPEKKEITTINENIIYQMTRDDATEIPYLIRKGDGPKPF